jgi:hypothetical protein
MDGARELRDYLTRFFARYTPVSVEVIQRHVGTWFAFAETRWKVSPADDGAPLAFLVAEYAEIGSDRKIVARIGHGTDPAPA